MGFVTDLVGVTAGEAVFLLVAAFFAGVVRGFSGFGTSAVLMAAAAPILPPVAMIPACWMVEAAASAALARDGVRDAEKPVAVGMFGGMLLGAPLGLLLTTAVDVDVSRWLALSLIAVLAGALLARERARGRRAPGAALLDTWPGRITAGLGTGLALGVASVGGLVGALAVMTWDRPARTLRGTLILYLILSSAVFGFYLFAYGMLSQLSVTRGFVFALVALSGVFVGARLFSPRFQPYYRPFSLALLVALAVFGLLRAMI